jgi:hypothetical protein
LAKTSHFSSIFAVAQNLGHGVTVAQKSYVAAANLLEIEQGETVEGIAGIETIGRAIMQKCGLDVEGIEKQIKETTSASSRKKQSLTARQILALNDGFTKETWKQLREQAPDMHKFFGELFRIMKDRHPDNPDNQ